MIHTQYFHFSEFREWAEIMSPRLLTMLDVLRHRLGKQVLISANSQSLGRHLGSSESAHNVDRWGDVLAADLFIKGVYNQDDARHVVNVAQNLGFTGIGVYPEWRNNIGETQVGFHLDVRPTRDMGKPATWGQVGGEFVSLQLALELIEE